MPACLLQGAPGEQLTMFLLDPSGNALEFKYMTNVRLAVGVCFHGVGWLLLPAHRQCPSCP